MRNVRNRLSITLALTLVLVVAAVGALEGPFFSSWPLQQNIASAQSPPPPPNRDAPSITSLTQATFSSITVNWQAADDTDAHWIYSVKTDGSGGQFTTTNAILPHSTTVSGLEDETTYWFAVIGSGAPSETSPNQWFSWSSWVKGTTLKDGRVSLGPDVAVAEGGIANLTVTTSVAPQSPLTVNYAIGTDDDPATVDGDSDDYTGSATGSITIPAEATEGIISIVINDDSDIDDGA